jgi:hypothetical protein
MFARGWGIQDHCAWHAWVYALPHSTLLLHAINRQVGTVSDRYVISTREPDIGKGDRMSDAERQFHYATDTRSPPYQMPFGPNLRESDRADDLLEELRR